MLIVTGTGRSGTETMARMLGGYHEFRVAYILEKYFTKAEPHSDPFDTLAKRLMVILDLHQGIDRNTFVDSSNLYIYFIDAVLKLYPAARFILSVRNGKDFVRSAFSRGWHERKSIGTAPLRDDPFFERWDTMTPVQKNSWIWVFRNTTALKGLIAVPEDQKLILRIEDISRPEIIDRIETFTGLRMQDRTRTEQRYNANPAFSLPPKEEWTHTMNAEFEEIAGGLMSQFRYG